MSFQDDELRLLRKLHEAAEQMGGARKHECPGFDCSTCNTTAVYEALNDLEMFYTASEKNDTTQKLGE